MLARAHKKFLREQHSEIYLPTLKEQDKTKMELPLDMVSKHAFWYPYLPDYQYVSLLPFIIRPQAKQRLYALTISVLLIEWNDILTLSLGVLTFSCNSWVLCDVFDQVIQKESRSVKCSRLSKQWAISYPFKTMILFHLMEHRLQYQPIRTLYSNKNTGYNG